LFRKNCFIANSFYPNLVIAGFVGISQAINCYECSGTDSDCADPFTADATLEVDCTTALLAVDDGDCSKEKTWGKVFGISVTTGESLVYFFTSVNSQFKGCFSTGVL